MVKRKDTRLTPGITLTLLLIALFTALEVGVFADYVPHLTSFSAQLDAHFFLTALFIGCAVLLAKLHIDTRYLLIFGLFMATLGPAGCLTIFVSICMYFVDIKFTQPITDLLSSLLPELKQDKSEQVYERILYHLDDFHPERIPIPFIDIMEFGNYKQKRMAIEKMLRYYRPEFARTLRKGLQDPSSAVKVQSATALNYIDHHMFAENIRLKNLHDADREDIDQLLKYAENTANYVHSDILDPDRREKMLDNAIHAYEAYIKQQPKNTDAIIALAQLNVDKGNYQHTKELMKELLSTEFLPKGALLMMHALYQLNELDELRAFARFAKNAVGEDISNEALSSAIHLWTEGVPKEITHNVGTLKEESRYG